MIEAVRKQIAFFFTVPALLWQIFFLYIPLVLVLKTAFMGDVVVSELFWSVFSWVHLVVLVRSVCTALFVAFACLLIGYPVAYFFALHMRSYRLPFLFFLTLPFWINFLVHVYAWFFMLERDGLINTLLMKLGVIHEPLVLLNSPGAVMCVMVYCYLPFMIVPLYSVLEGIEKDFLEASYDLGAGPVATFFRVTLPLTRSGIRTGFFLIFVPVFGEYAIPALLGGGKQLYVGGLISLYFLQARSEQLGAAFTLMSMCVVLLVGYGVYRLLRDPRLREE